MLFGVALYGTVPSSHFEHASIRSYSAPVTAYRSGKRTQHNYTVDVIMYDCEYGWGKERGESKVLAL